MTAFARVRLSAPHIACTQLAFPDCRRSRICSRISPWSDASVARDDGRLFLAEDAAVDSRSGVAGDRSIRISSLAMALPLGPTQFMGYDAYGGQHSHCCKSSTFPQCRKVMPGITDGLLLSRGLLWRNFYLLDNFCAFRTQYSRERMSSFCQRYCDRSAIPWSLRSSLPRPCSITRISSRRRFCSPRHGKNANICQVAEPKKNPEHPPLQALCDTTE